MIINGFSMYRDGGTVEIYTDVGIFCVDFRISSKTKGYLFDGYPNFDNSNQIFDSKVLLDIIECLINLGEEDFVKNKSIIETILKSNINIVREIKIEKLLN